MQKQKEKHFNPRGFDKFDENEKWIPMLQSQVFILALNTSNANNNTAY